MEQGASLLPLSSILDPPCSLSPPRPPSSLSLRPPRDVAAVVPTRQAGGRGGFGAGSHLPRAGSYWTSKVFARGTEVVRAGSSPVVQPRRTEMTLTLTS